MHQLMHLTILYIKHRSVSIITNLKSGIAVTRRSRQLHSCDKLDCLKMSNLASLCSPYKLIVNRKKPISISVKH